RFSRDWSSDVCSSDLAASSCPSALMSPYERSGVNVTVYGPDGSSAVARASPSTSAKPVLGGSSKTSAQVEVGYVRCARSMDRIRSEERRVGEEGRRVW